MVGPHVLSHRRKSVGLNVCEVPSRRSGFSDVDSSGGAGNLVEYLDATRMAPSIIEAKEWSLHRLDIRSGDAVLDVGCGTGEDVVAMLQRIGSEGKGVGIDRSASMVSEAVRRHGLVSNAFFAVADARILPFRSDSFDAVRCERTLQHVGASPTAAVIEMVRLLRPGGRLTLLEPDWGTLVVEGADPRITEVVVGNHVKRHAQPHMGSKLRGLMTAEGLIVEEVGGRAVFYADLPSAIRAFGLGQAAPMAIASGSITQDEADRWVQELWQADREDRFFASVTGFRVFGRKQS